MEKDTLFETLKSGSMFFTVAEIEQIMNEELNKNPEEMDTELVDLCAEVLSKAYFTQKTAAGKTDDVNEQTRNTKGKRVTLKKFIPVAAVVAAICGITISVSAQYVHFDASNEIVEFFSTHFKTDLQSGQTGAEKYSDEENDIIKDLKEQGFDEVILPAELLSGDYISELKGYTDEENFMDADIYFENIENGTDGYIGITRWKSEEAGFSIGRGNMAESYDSVKQLTVNGMDVLVFGGSNSEDSYIKYVDGYTEYCIFINCDFDTAVDIAKTLE